MSERGVGADDLYPLAFDLDVFKVLHRATVLGRQNDVTATGSTGCHRPLEIMNARLARLGVRFRF